MSRRGRCEAALLIEEHSLPLLNLQLYGGTELCLHGWALTPTPHHQGHDVIATSHGWPCARSNSPAARWRRRGQRRMYTRLLRWAGTRLSAPTSKGPRHQKSTTKPTAIDVSAPSHSLSPAIEPPNLSSSSSYEGHTKQSTFTSVTWLRNTALTRTHTAATAKRTGIVMHTPRLPAMT